jgi:hypothetical protein
MDELSRFYRSRIFEIPSQQRPYSWKTSQIKDLLLDLKISYNRRTHHYCGPIFLEKTKLPDGHLKDNIQDKRGAQLVHYNILDGQQRVTSIILIATALAKHPLLVTEVNNGNSSAALIQRGLMDLSSYISVGNTEHDRSRMNFNNPEMDDMMSHMMFSDPPNAPNATTAGVRRLEENYRYIQDEILQLCEITNSTELVAIGDHFLEGMKVILVEMGSHNFNKYTVFESINNRGLNLSEFDKIKNLFLHIAEQHEARSVKNGVLPLITPALIEQSWYNTIQTLYDYDLLDEEEKCITDLWGVINRETKTKEHQIFSVVKDKFETLVDNDDANLITELQSYYQNWNNYTEGYCKIYTQKPGQRFSAANMNAAGEENLKRMLYQIQLPQVFRRPLTCAMMKYNHNDFGEVSEFFEKALMRIHGMRTKRTISAIDGPLNRLANEIFTGLNVSGCKSAICTLVVDHAPLGEVVKNLVGGTDVYNKSWRGNTVYYFLYRIDLLLNLGMGHGVPIVFPSEASQRTVQIEHILPQKHTTNWSASWPTPEVADTWVHRIGNLTLTTNKTTNNQLGNKSMEDKCVNNHPSHTYQTGRAVEQRLLPIASKYQTTHEWRKLEILENELEYAHFFVKLWSLPCDCDLIETIVLDAFSEHINDEKQALIEDYDTEDRVTISIVPQELVHFDEIIACQHDEEE